MLRLKASVTKVTDGYRITAATGKNLFFPVAVVSLHQPGCRMAAGSFNLTICEATFHCINRKLDKTKIVC
ncbi:MAG: hypothetical protein PUD71_10480 [Lachnospiraceae bacterium]|nr:hypothetical protein [Lachnospiraceae bacterium]MDD6858778.1 hypothetical protein [Lachnospiraceae bacterium]